METKGQEIEILVMQYQQERNMYPIALTSVVVVVWQLAILYLVVLLLPGEFNVGSKSSCTQTQPYLLRVYSVVRYSTVRAIVYIVLRTAFSNRREGLFRADDVRIGDCFFQCHHSH